MMRPPRFIRHSSWKLCGVVKSRVESSADGDTVMVHMGARIAMHWKELNHTASPKPSLRTSKMSTEGWWMVHTTVRPVSTVLRTARIMIAADRASRPVCHSDSRLCRPVDKFQMPSGSSPNHASSPEVGSSMKTMEGLATSSTAMVSRLRCSTDRPLRPVHGPQD